MRAGLESVRSLKDGALVERVRQCVSNERVATAELIATLSEFDVRQLYLAEGYGSLFDYCIRSLHLSERAAGSRIAAARLARRFPLVLELIADSRVSLTAVALLARYLNEANYRLLLEEATHKTAEQVQTIVARLAPKPDAPALVRRVAGSRELPASLNLPAEIDPASVEIPVSRVESALIPAPPPRRPPPQLVKPLAPERFKIQFTISGETREKLRVTQDLLRHSLPSGDLEKLFDRALSALLADLEKRKLALVPHPRKHPKPARQGTRLIPAAVRRAVWSRDKGRCAFVGREGRCRERKLLELHHVKPFAVGGASTVENIQLRCRAHNAHEADLYSRLGPIDDHDPGEDEGAAG